MHPRGIQNILMGVILAMVSFAGAIVQGQTSPASLTGKVEDGAGAMLPGAAVTVTNLETNAIRRTTSDSTGSYLVLSLPVGHYEVRASATGFKTKVETNVSLVVGQQATLNILLEIGQVSESVTVFGDPGVLNLGTSSVTGMVGEKEIKNLPLNGRSFDNLITLNTSTINYTSFSSTAASGGGAGAAFHIDGRRATENLFLLNGIEYTGESNRSNQPGGVSGQLLGVDAIREFNVLTESYSAEYGKRPGGQIAVVTQSGSNQLHGTVFEFLRNSALDARNYFDPSAAQLGHRIPGFQRNQFGGSLGGPIRRDKLFAFSNYEGFRQALGLPVLVYVPDDQARQGNLPNSSGVYTPVANANAGMLPFFQLWPKANGPELLTTTGLASGIATYSGSPKEHIREDFGTVRLDQNFTAKDQLSETYTIDDGRSLIPQSGPVFSSDYYIRNQVLSAQETHIFSERALNTFRAGYSRATFKFNVEPVVSLPSSLSFFGGLEPGSLTIGGGLTTAAGTSTLAKVGATANYLYGTRNLFTYADDYQILLGKHHVSVGGWFQRMQDNRNGANRKAGAVTFSNLTTFIQGTESGFQGVPNPTYSGYRLWMGAWYAQDDWAITPRLTVNLGLRHEFTGIITEVHGKIANTFLDANGYMSSTPFLGSGFPKNDATRMFGPRVGLAWDIFGNGNTAVHSGFGLHYSLMDYEFWIWDGIAPNNTTVDYGANKPFLSLIPVSVGVAGPPICAPGVAQPCLTISQKGILSNVSPAVAEWNLSIEQKIGPRNSFRLGYVGSHGYHEPITTDHNSIRPLVCDQPAGCLAGGLNAAHTTVNQGTLYVPVASTRPNPFLSSSTNTESSNSSYNALQAEFRQHLSRGLLFRVNYTYSKALDVFDETGGTESGNSPPQVLYPYTPRLDWGASSTDVRDAFSVSGIYELPFGKGKAVLKDAGGAVDRLVGGWQVNTICSLLGGFPFNPIVGAAVAGNGNTSNPDRPSLNTTFSGPIITHDPTRWYNPSAFAVPASGTFGTLRKGTFRGPGLAEWDLSFVKNTRITERINTQFRFEAFNVLNHTNFSFPNQTVWSTVNLANPSANVISPTAGRITATATSSRQLQAALKLVF